MDFYFFLLITALFVWRELVSYRQQLVTAKAHEDMVKDLLDRLMAASYVEYKQTNIPVSTPRKSQDEELWTSMRLEGQ